MHLGEAIEASVLNYHLRNNAPGGKQLLKLINSSNEVEGGSVYTMRQRAIYIASKKPKRQVRDKKGNALFNEDGSIMLEDDPTKFSWHKWDDSLKAKWAAY